MVPECFNCGHETGKQGFARALVQIYSREEESVEIVDGKRDPTYKEKKRWVCLDCLFTRIGSNAFEEGMEYAEG